MLTAEELFKKYQKQFLIESKKFYITGMSKEDVEQEVSMKLWEACLENEASEELEFIAYARKKIENHLINLRNASYTEKRTVGISFYKDRTEWCACCQDYASFERGICQSCGTQLIVEKKEKWQDIDEVLYKQFDPYEHIENILDNPEEWQNVLSDKDLTSKLYMEVNSFELIRKAKELSGSTDPETLRKYIIKWMALLMFACKTKALKNRQRNELNEALKQLKLDSDENIKWNIRQMDIKKSPNKTNIELYS